MQLVYLKMKELRALLKKTFYSPPQPNITDSISYITFNFCLNNLSSFIQHTINIHSSQIPHSSLDTSGFVNKLLLC